MTQPFREMQDEDFVEASYADEETPAVVQVEGELVSSEQQMEEEELLTAQDVRKRVLLNLADGKGGILNDKELMYLALTAARDMDTQVLKKRTIRVKQDSANAQAATAASLEAMQRTLLETGMSIQPKATRERAPDALNPANLLPSKKMQDGEFKQDTGVQESSSEFFARMENRQEG